MSLEAKKPPYKRQRLIKLKSGRNTPIQSTSRSPTPSSLSPFPESIQKDSPVYLDMLIKKLFYHQHTKERELLPNLTSYRDIDTQLYCLVGLLFRSFIHRWYDSITDDPRLTSELLAVISHLTKQLEIRFKKVDVLGLLLDDIPYVLDDHLKNFRKVRMELGSVFLPYETIDSAFDFLSGHTALCEDANDEKRYLRILSKAVLRELMPEVDLKSRLAQKFLSRLVSDLLLGNLIEKLSQPYQMFEIIQQICKGLDELPPELAKNSDITISEKALSIYQAFLHFTTPKDTYRKSDIIYSHLFTFLNNLFELNSERPVLYAIIKSIAILQPTAISTILLNLFDDYILKPLQSENIYVTILKAARNNLFPTDEDMGPPRIEPTSAEFEEIREQTKNMMKAACNRFGLFSGLFIASNDAVLDDELDTFLTGFENKRINKHLLYKLLDLVIIKLLPELTL